MGQKYSKLYNLKNYYKLYNIKFKSLFILHNLKIYFRLFNSKYIFRSKSYYRLCNQMYCKLYNLKYISKFHNLKI